MKTSIFSHDSFLDLFTEKRQACLSIDFFDWRNNIYSIATNHDFKNNWKYQEFSYHVFYEKLPDP